MDGRYIVEEPKKSASRGFTLVELLVVMIVIGILVALLLPVISGAVRTSKNAAVSAEFQTIGASLEAFRTTYGEYPPSRIMVCEDGYWNTSDTTMIPVDGGSDITYGQLANRSVAAIRKFFPGVPISTTAAQGVLFDGTGTWYDFNGNGVFDGPKVAGRGVILDGAECLCFFLGGVPMNSGTAVEPSFSLSGFAVGKVAYAAGTLGTLPKSHPFRNNLDNGNRAYGGNRAKSYHEFVARRLIDIDGNGFPGYADQLTSSRPIAYFRSDNPGYDPNDINIPEPPMGGTATSGVRAFRVAFTVAGSDVRTAVSPAPNPYSSSAAHQNPDGTAVPTVAWHKPSSYQLISPGADGMYGLGGQYDANKSIKLPAEAGTANTNDTDTGLREVEKDNLTNFTGGTLD